MIYFYKKYNYIMPKNKCQNLICNNKVYNINNKYCFKCYNLLHPSDYNFTRNDKKVNEVKKFIQNEFKDLNIIFDKPINCNGGVDFNVYVDIFINLINHYIIIEVDEKQERFNDPLYDKLRTNNIKEALKIPVIIIRFNYNKVKDLEILKNTIIKLNYQ